MVMDWALWKRRFESFYINRWQFNCRFWIIYWMWSCIAMQCNLRRWFYLESSTKKPWQIRLVCNIRSSKNFLLRINYACYCASLCAQADGKAILTWARQTLSKSKCKTFSNSEVDVELLAYMQSTFSIKPRSVSHKALTKTSNKSISRFLNENVLHVKASP